MERYPSPSRNAERAEDRSLRLMADEAEKLASRFARLADAVYQTLTNNHVEGKRRTESFGRIMAELRKREAVRSRANARATDARAAIEADRRNTMMRDAFAHEKRQPPDAYDPDAEEDARRDI